MRLLSVFECGSVERKRAYFAYTGLITYAAMFPSLFIFIALHIIRSLRPEQDRLLQQSPNDYGLRLVIFSVRIVSSLSRIVCNTPLFPTLFSSKITENATRLIFRFRFYCIKKGKHLC